MKAKQNKTEMILRFVLTFGIILSSCSNANKYSDTPTMGEITIVADETFKPILDAELEVFHALYNYAKVNAEYKTEMEALNDLFADRVRFIISSRPLKRKEVEFFHDKKFFPQELKIAIDGIALISNRNNPDSLITANAFRKILSGDITRWKQVNPKSKLGKIKVVFDNKNSSTVRYLLDSLCNNLPISQNHTALEHNSEVIDFVEANTDVIGVIGLSWISDKDDTTMLSFLRKVRVLAVSKNDSATWGNSYQPYQAYIAKGLYPFIRNIYIINSEPRKGLATGFAAFIASERGQRIILKSGILPATQPYRIIEVKDHF
jgi:phosphate transport system substrate-binding protein